MRRNDIFYLDKNLYEQKAQHGNQTEFATPAMNRCLEVYLGVANRLIAVVSIKMDNLYHMNNRKISRVIVLGAGASCSYCESPTGLRPPLAREIIPTFHKLDISTNRYVLVGHIINYVRDTRGIFPHEFASWGEDLETFFSEIDEEIAKYAERIKGKEKLDSKTFYKYSLAVGAYNQLIFLFASIFNEIQNGPISIPYMLLASELNQNDVVITFNWDTLFDRALAASDKWSPSNGYCIRPEAVFDDEWKSPDDLDDVDNGPLYIKLHGSTNWLSPYHSINLSSGGK